MPLSLRARFGNISTALIWSLGNRKVNCTMYRGKIDFQEHLALYYWAWNEIKVILLGHKLLPATVGKVYKLYLGLMKTWCVYLYMHACVCWGFFLLLSMARDIWAWFYKFFFSLNFHVSPLQDILLLSGCVVFSVQKWKIIRHISFFICHHSSLSPGNRLVLEKDIKEQGISGNTAIAFEIH